MSFTIDFRVGTIYQFTLADPNRTRLASGPEGAVKAMGYMVGEYMAGSVFLSDPEEISDMLEDMEDARRYEGGLTSEEELEYQDLKVLQETHSLMKELVGDGKWEHLRASTVITDPRMVKIKSIKKLPGEKITMLGLLAAFLNDVSHRGWTVFRVDEADILY